MTERERRFFRTIGVDRFVTWFGKLAPCNAYDNYLLSKADMEKFGLTNIEMRADYHRTDLTMLNKGGKPQFQFIDADSATVESIRPSP